MIPLPIAQTVSLPAWPLYAVLGLVVVAIAICIWLGVRDLVLANRMRRESNKHRTR